MGVEQALHLLPQEEDALVLVGAAVGDVLGQGVAWHTLGQYALLFAGFTAMTLVLDERLGLLRGSLVSLVLLLFFFYVVLSGGNGIFAAVAAFSINFSNLACTLLQTSIDSVGRDQIEAGRALGFNKMQNIRYIVAPQALKNALPTFKYQAVAMVKSTSIVGYVAITDLTKATEAIRSASNLSFIPLLLVTAIYFILAWLLCKLLDYIAVKTTRI